MPADTAPNRFTLFTALKHRNFALLWGSQLVSQLGDMFHGTAAAVLIYNLTGSPLNVSLYFVVRELPNILLGLFAGPVIDRVNKKWIMITADLIRFLLVLLAPLVVLRNVSAIYPITLGVALCTVFFRPTKYALVPEIIPRGSALVTATAITETTDSFAGVVGWSLGGLLVATAGAVVAFYLDSLTFLLSAVLLLFMTYRPRLVTARPSLKSIPVDVLLGLKYIVRVSVLRDLFWYYGVFILGLGGLYALPIVMAEQVYGVGAWGYGLIQAITSIGFIAGGLLVGQRAGSFHRGRSLTLGITAIGALTTGIGLNRAFPIGLLLFGATGVVSAFYFIPMISILQHYTDDAFRGRVLATRSTVFGSLLTLSIAGSGWTASHVGVGLTFTCQGVFMLVWGLIGLTVRTVREQAA